MRIPDFLVVGAARAGTTALHSYLRQHPDIFLPRLKEPCFFVFDGDHKKYVGGKFSFAIRNFDDYQRLFISALPGQKIGEMSTPYLYLYDKSISTIQRYFKDYSKIKIVILLRNPVDRAYSQYKWRVRDGREKLNFNDAVGEEKVRMMNNYSFDYYYVDRGFYYKQVKAYKDNFKEVLVVFFEDFNNDPNTVLKEISRFIGLRDNINFKRVQRMNEGASPRSVSLSRFITMEVPLKFKLLNLLPESIRRNLKNIVSYVNEQKKDSDGMNPLMRQKLIEIYREDIIALGQLTGRDLSEWLK